MPRLTAFMLLLVALLAASCGRASPPASPSSPSSAPSTAPSAATSPPPLGELAAQSVSFISAQEGWLLAGSLCGKQVCGSILHSTDRGGHWTRAGAVPLSLGSGTDQVSEVRFADANNGFLFSSALLATHDGGATWKPLDVGGPVVALATGKSRVFAIVSPCYQSDKPQCTQLPNLVSSDFKTDEWQPVTGFAFRPGSTAPQLAVEGDAVFVLEDSTPPLLFGSKNGATFARLNLPCPGEPEPSRPSALAASSPADLAILCVGGAGAGSAGKQVFVSADGGLTYRKLADAPLGGIPNQLAAASPSTLAITAASGATYLYRTAGGSSWSNGLEFGDGGVGLSSLEFVDAQHGAVVYGPAATSLGLPDPRPEGLGTLYLSDDAGATWRAAALTG